MPAHKVSRELRRWSPLITWLDNKLNMPLTARDWLSPVDEAATETREAGLYDVARAWRRTAPDTGD